MRPSLATMDINCFGVDHYKMGTIYQNLSKIYWFHDRQLSGCSIFAFFIKKLQWSDMEDILISYSRTLSVIHSSVHLGERSTNLFHCRKCCTASSKPTSNNINQFLLDLSKCIHIHDRRDLLPNDIAGSWKKNANEQELQLECEYYTNTSIQMVQKKLTLLNPHQKEVYYLG